MHLTKNNVQTSEQAVDYLIDCTLATVEGMIGLKSTPKEGEFKRQCDIAQFGIDFLGRDYPFTSRAKKLARNETAFQFYTREHQRRLRP